MENKFEIDFKRLLLDLLYRCWIIVLCAVVLAGAAYLYARTQLTPLYTAASSLYVNNYDSKISSEVQKVSSADLYTSQSLVQTYLTFLSTDRVLDKVSEKIHGKYNAAQIRGMMGAAALDETEIFQVTITNPDPKEAQQIVNMISDMAPEVITEYIEGSSVKVVDYAKVPTLRSFPIYRKYIKYGAVAGGGISLVILVILFLFNAKINTEEDIEKLFTAPIIGSIPKFDQVSHSSSYHYEYANKNGKEKK